MEIVIPQGALVVLIGVAGAGKSTFAARHFRPDEVLSSDAFRGMVGASEADQTVSRPAFAILHRQLDERLSAGRMTVVDATNVTGWARRVLLARAAAHGRPAVAIVLDLPEALCIAQNSERGEADRGRVVPLHAIRRQSRDLRRSLRDPASLFHEGFVEVYELASREALDAVGIVRRAFPGHAAGLLPLSQLSEREDQAKP